MEGFLEQMQFFMDACSFLKSDRVNCKLVFLLAKILMIKRNHLTIKVIEK